MLELMTGKRLKTCAGHYGGVYCVTGHPVEQVRGGEEGRGREET